MRALIVVDVPEAFMRQRAAEASAEGETVTADEYFAGCLRDVVDDALPVALFGWPAGISIAFPCPECHGEKTVPGDLAKRKPCPTCRGTGDRPGTEAFTPA